MSIVNSDKRFFTIAGAGTNVKPNTGRYTATGPSQAGKKAGARLYRDLSEADIKKRTASGKKGIKFILRETTQGSKKGTFYYVVTRKTLSNPTRVKIGDKVIEYKYEYTIAKSDADSVAKDIKGGDYGKLAQKGGNDQNLEDYEDNEDNEHLMGGKSKQGRKKKSKAKKMKGGEEMSGMMHSDHASVENMIDPQLMGGGRRRKKRITK
jgi:hypothetical protein